MERIIIGYSSLIGKAFEIIPNKIATRIRYTHFFVGNDAVFAGLTIGYEIPDGRSFRDTAHVCHAHNQLHLPKNLRHTTVVLPFQRPLNTVVHELAHVLDEVLDWEHIAKPVTKYAETNRAEAFAEAFTAWLFWGYGDEIDEATKALFNQQAGIEV